ncbi:c-type heme family protein [Sulfitobacter sp. MF3-043]|uniref:c-type heme family protein n=1 Tax=Sulfitobacter sediminivivens TaxID=3252902 RepID=UPI0036DE1E63
MTRFWPILLVSCSLLIAAKPDSIDAQQSLAALADEGQRLASLLRVGRGVISNNQDLINDPTIGDKGLSSEAFLKAVEANYMELYGTAPLEGGLSPEQIRLTEAQLASMSEVMDEHQDLINSEGMAFKGFIPAIFARLVNERFVSKLGDDAKVKVTAPLHLVRNRKARPDEWENAVLTDKFNSADWPKGDAFYEEISVDGSMIFRMLIPEYYGESCLSCHGGPKGEVDVTGFPKEGGAAGDLAGAISITLKK